MSAENINARRRSPEITSIDDLRNKYPRQWVAIEVTEVTPQVGITRGVVLAHGPRRAEETVVSKLVEWRSRNPDKEFGLFYTGNFARPGQDIVTTTA